LPEYIFDDFLSIDRRVREGEERVVREDDTRPHLAG